MQKLIVQKKTSSIFLTNLEIINPNHYIATISDSNFLEIEFKFEYGVGYKLASQNFYEKSNDFLEMDAIFMPVQKVDFKIENVYNEYNEVTERLIIEIWTNGSVSPATTILREQGAKVLRAFVDSIDVDKITVMHGDN